MDFDFTTETITPDATNVLTIGGTGGLEVPIGTTLQRPSSPINGVIRYNTDSGQLEGYYNNSWAPSTVVTGNQVIVQLTPGAGQFSSIAAAVASITTASATEPWRVLIGPGIYTEPQIDIPSYVYVTGNSEYETTVVPDSPTHHVFTLSDNSTLSFVQIENSGSGYAGVYAMDCENYALCHKVSLSSCDIGFWFQSDTIDSIVYLEYCDTTDGTTGLRVESLSGKQMFVNSENWYVLISGATAPTDGVYISGIGAEVHLLSYGILADGATNGDGVHIQDGGSLTAVAGSISGWDVGLHMPNTGAATNANIDGVSISEANTFDVSIQHPLATGSLNGSTNRSRISLISGAVFSLLILDIESDNGTLSNGPLYLGEDFNALTDVTDLIQEASPTGLLNGGVLSPVTGLQLHITAGYGYVVDSTNLKEKRVSWTDTTITIADNVQNYVYIDNTENVTYSSSIPSATQTILLGRARPVSGTINTLAIIPVKANTAATYIDQYLRNAIGAIFGFGCVTTAGSTPLTLDVTNGTYYYSLLTFNPTGGSPITFQDVYHVGGVPTLSTGHTTVDNVNYDNLTDLTPIPTGYYTKHSLYVAGDGLNEVFGVLYGQTVYSNLLDCQNGPLPSPPTATFIDITIPVASVIVQQGNPNIVQIIDIRPRLGFTTPAISGGIEHGDLLGLLDDDHPQYLLVTGTRAMTGNLNMGSNNIVSVGTINSVTIQTHGGRHGANSADPVFTAAPSAALTPSSTNGVGIADSLARSDHSHQITGFQPLATNLTSLSSYNTNGILTQTASGTFAGRTITGTTSRISVTNGNGVSGNPTIDIDSAYVGQTSITTVGTITSGTWTGTTIALANGGTGATTQPNAANAILPSQTSNSGKFLTTNGTNVSWATTGTVTSIAVSGGTTGLTTSGGPVTSSGTITLAGTLAIANGGTGQVTASTAFNVLSPVTSTGDLIIGSGTNSSTRLAIGSNGQLLTSNGTTATWANVASGSYAVLVTPNTLVSGNKYYVDVTHNLGTNNIGVTLWDNSTNAFVLPDSWVQQSTNVVRITVIGNTRTYRAVVIANGTSIAAGGSTPSSIIVQNNGVALSGTYTSINLTGVISAVNSGAGVATLSQSASTVPIRTYSYFASSLDSPNNADWAINALAPAIADPTNAGLTVRQFSNSANQGVGMMMSVPSGATNITFSYRGRNRVAATGSIQFYLYTRSLSNGSTTGAWSSANALTAITGILSNTNWNYYTYTATIASLSLSANNLYQFEFVRNTGVASNLAQNWLLNELTISFT